MGKKWPIVTVHWHDAYATGRKTVDGKDLEPSFPVTTCGILLHRSKKAYVVAQNHFYGNCKDDAHFTDEQIIPRRWIEKVDVLGYERAPYDRKGER